MSGLDVVFEDPGGVAAHQRSRGQISCDDARCPNDTLVSDRYTRQDDGMRADETIITNAHVGVAVVDVVVRQERDAERDGCVFPDVEADVLVRTYENLGLMYVRRPSQRCT